MPKPLFNACRAGFLVGSLIAIMVLLYFMWLGSVQVPFVTISVCGNDPKELERMFQEMVKKVESENIRSTGLDGLDLVCLRARYEPVPQEIWRIPWGVILVPFSVVAFFTVLPLLCYPFFCQNTTPASLLPTPPPTAQSRL
jgi:hypothetical protein